MALLPHEWDVTDFAKFLFSRAVGVDHQGIKSPYDRIIDRALPLIHDLIQLGEEVEEYKTVDYIDRHGNRHFSRKRRIDMAQRRKWGYSAGSLEVGDQFIRTTLLRHNNPPVYTVECKYDGYIMAEYGEHYSRISINDLVVCLPKDFEAKYMEYSDEAYWIKIADELGI
jgi:hypothetical protein